MVASEKKRRSYSSYSSCCSSSWLPTNLMIEASLTKMSTTLVRCLISLLRRINNCCRSPFFLGWAVRVGAYAAIRSELTLSPYG